MVKEGTGREQRLTDAVVKRLPATGEGQAGHATTTSWQASAFASPPLALRSLILNYYARRPRAPHHHRRAPALAGHRRARRGEAVRR